jgi:hypothetical protein
LLVKLFSNEKIAVIVLLLSVSHCGYSQKLEAEKVPQAIKDAFKKAHPTSTAS